MQKNKKTETKTRRKHFSLKLNAATQINAKGTGIGMVSERASGMQLVQAKHLKMHHKTSQQHKHTTASSPSSASSSPGR